MQTHDFQNKIQNILYGEKGHGLSVFCCVKKGGIISLKRFNVQDDFRGEINDLIANSISMQFLNDDVAYDYVDNISDNDNVLYLIEITKQYNPFGFLTANSTVNEDFTENDRDGLLGFAFRFSIDSNIMWAYQHVYPVSVSKQSKGLYAVIGGKSIFNKIDSKKVFFIGNRIDVVIIENTICPIKIKFLEQNFHFEVFIRSEAQKTVEIIEATKLIKNVDKFNAFMTKEKLTNAKKLLKIKKSPILSIPIEIITKRLSEIPRYSNIKIQDGQIVVKTEKDIVNILKMLSDDFLRSELSLKEYDSPSKKILPDV